MPDNDQSWQKWLLGIVATLIGLGIVGGIVAWNTTSQRLAVIEFQLQQQSEKAQLDAEQSDSIGKLWSAAAQNRAAINKRHRDTELHEWAGLGERTD